MSAGVAVRVLVVEHEDDAPAAWVGRWLVDAGAELDVRRPYLGQALPVDLAGRFIYYVGPVDPVRDEVVGPAGPTTATRMDKFTEQVLAQTGLLGMIGKAERGPLGLEAIRKHRSEAPRSGSLRFPTMAVGRGRRAPTRAPAAWCGWRSRVTCTSSCSTGSCWIDRTRDCARSHPC